MKLIRVLLALNLTLIAGCAAKSSPTRATVPAPAAQNYAAAIDAVLQRDRDAYEATEQYRNQPNPRSMQRPSAGEVLDYAVAQMEAIDTRGCPSDFREAYVRHIYAWRDMAREVKSKQKREGDALLGAILGYATGNAPLALGSLSTATKQSPEIEKASKAIEVTFGEVRALAVRYGAK